MKAFLRSTAALAKSALWRALEVFPVSTILVIIVSLIVFAHCTVGFTETRAEPARDAQVLP